MVEADLHLHSYHSDGVYSPSAIVTQAAQAGLRAIALTDHDTVNGIEEARRAAPATLEVLAGVELSSVYRGREIHLLAYDLDPVDAALVNFLEPVREQRRRRADRIVTRLNRLGLPVTLKEVEEIASGSRGGPPASVGRPHIARAIIRHGGASDIDEAFSRYLGKGCPAFVPRASIPVQDALELVRSRGGFLVVAHPALNLTLEQTSSLASEGLDGIEVWHPRQSPKQRKGLLEIVNSLGLVASGGSDYHGIGRQGDAIAVAGVRLTALEALKEAGRRKKC